jgi:hypothetical protein
MSHHVKRKGAFLDSPSKRPAYPFVANSDEDVREALRDNREFTLGPRLERLTVGVYLILIFIEGGLDTHVKASSADDINLTQEQVNGLTKALADNSTLRQLVFKST